MNASSAVITAQESCLWRGKDDELLMEWGERVSFYKKRWYAERERGRKCGRTEDA